MRWLLLLVALAVVLVACGALSTTPTPAPPTPRPTPSVNPTTRAYQAAQATEQARIRASHCRTLAKMYAEYGQTYDPTLGPELVYLDLLRLRGIEPGSSASHSYGGVTIVQSARESAYGCLG